MVLASLLLTSFGCKPLIEGLGNFLEVCHSRTPFLSANNFRPRGHSRFELALSRVSDVH